MLTDYSTDNFQGLNLYESRKTDVYYRTNGDLHVYIMSRERSIDIDTQFDFGIVKFLLKGIFTKARIPAFVTYGHVDRRCV